MVTCHESEFQERHGLREGWWALDIGVDTKAAGPKQVVEMHPLWPCRDGVTQTLLRQSMILILLACGGTGMLEY